MRNKILLKLAIFFLKRINADKIEFQNSFRYYVGQLGDFKNFKK